jgi:hypothetical protein
MDDLSEKQRQFNAAMDRYNGRPGYVRFGKLVASVNIVLQLYLLWRVLPLDLSLPLQMTAVAAAWILTDFVNGLVHMVMDNSDRYESIAGPLVANFHLHHRTPRYERHSLPVVYFNETGSKVWLIGYLLVVALLMEEGLHPVASAVLVYTGVLSSVAEVSHYLAHTSRSKLAVFLGDAGILLGKRRHARHHLENNVSYAFLNAWTDPPIDRLAARLYKGYKLTTDLHYGTYAGGDAKERF